MARELKITITADSAQAKQALTEVEHGISGVSQNTETMAASMKAALGILTSQQVRQFVGELREAAAQFVEAFAEQEKATKSLTQALIQQGTFTPQLGKQYEELSTHFENTTVFSDELIQSMEALLVQVGNVAPTQMKGALKAATDLAAGLGIDLRTATLLVAKAFEGHTETLGRYGIVLDQTKLKADPIATVLEGINSKFGGQAQAQLETYTGKMQHFHNEMNNVEESAGGLVVNALKPMLDAFESLNPTVQTFILGAIALGTALTPAALSFAALLPGLKILISALPEMGGVAVIAGTALGTLATAATVVAATFGAWEFGKWIGGITGLTDAVGRFTARLMGVPAATYDAMRSAQQWEDVVKATGGRSKNGDISLDGPATGGSGSGLTEIFPLSDKVSASLQKGTLEQQKFQSGLDAITGKLSGSDVITAARQWTMAVDAIGGASKLTADETKEFEKAITAAADKMIVMGQVVPRYWRTIAAGIHESDAAAQTGKVMGEQLGQAVKTPSPQLFLPTLDNPQTRDLLSNPNNVPGAGVQTNQIIRQGQTLGAQLTAGFREGVNSLPQVILGAIQGGGSVVGAISSKLGGDFAGTFSGTVSKGLGGLLGKGLGSAIGGIMGPLGSALGPLVGQLVSRIGASVWHGIQGMFGTDEEARQVNPARDAFAAQFRNQFGGSNSDAVTKALEAAGLGGERAAALIAQFNAADTMQEFNASKAAIEAALKSTDKSIENVTDSTKDLNLALTGSDDAIQKLGQTQDRVTQIMVQGFDRLIGKLDDFINRLVDAGKAAAAVASVVPSAPDVPTLSTPGDVITDSSEPPIETFHSGGMVWRRAHKGMMLGPDEVPIIAQTGERVLNRAETKAYNAGKAGGMNVSFGPGSVVVHGAGKNADQLAAELAPKLMQQIYRFNAGGSRSRAKRGTA